MIKPFFQMMLPLLLLLSNQQTNQHWLEKIRLSFHRFPMVQYQVLFNWTTIPIPIHFYLFVHRIVLVNDHNKRNSFFSKKSFRLQVILVQLHCLCWTIQYRIQQLLNHHHQQQQHLFNVDHFQLVVHHHLQHQVDLDRFSYSIDQVNRIDRFFFLALDPS